MDQLALMSLSLSLLVGAVGTATVLLALPNERLPWGFAVVFPTLIVWAFALGASMILRKDRAPDLLGTIARQGYYNREGFCFAFSIESRDGVAFLRVWFQNQYERPCVAEIGLRPTPLMFRRTPRFERLRLRVECESAAMGVATVALPVPANVQGTSLQFDVGASVKYPQGGGRRLRMAIGMPVSWSAARVGEWPRPKINRPVELRLPDDVDTTIAGDRYHSVRTFWKLGDPPLERWPEDLWSGDPAEPTTDVTDT